MPAGATGGGGSSGPSITPGENEGGGGGLGSGASPERRGVAKPGEAPVIGLRAAWDGRRGGPRVVLKVEHENGPGALTNPLRTSPDAQLLAAFAAAFLPSESGSGQRRSIFCRLRLYRLCLAQMPSESR